MLQDLSTWQINTALHNNHKYHLSAAAGLLFVKLSFAAVHGRYKSPNTMKYDEAERDGRYVCFLKQLRDHTTMTKCELVGIGFRPMQQG